MNWKREEQLRAVYETINGINALYGTMARRFGLNYNSLMMFNLLEDGNPYTQQDVCHILQLPKSTVHSILKDFMKNGYVFLDDGANKKEKVIQLTDSGQAYVREVVGVMRRAEIKALDSLGEAGCEQLVRVNEAFYEALKKEVNDE